MQLSSGKAVSIDDHVQVLDVGGVARNGSLESLDALLVHIDWEGDVKLHAPRPLHETLVVQKLSSWWMVVQSNGMPSVTSIADTHAIPERCRHHLQGN